MTIVPYPSTPPIIFALEPDDDGFHAIVFDTADTVLWITDSYSLPTDAEQAAYIWWLRNSPEQRSAS